MNSPIKTLGWHWFLDLSQCQSLPSTIEELESIMLDAAELAGATIVDTCFHAFSPIGLSGVIVIAESHLAVHTWPEHQAACIDLFSCTETLNIEAAFDHLRKQFQSQHSATRQSLRQINNSPSS